MEKQIIVPTSAVNKSEFLQKFRMKRYRKMLYSLKFEFLLSKLFTCKKQVNDVADQLR